MRLNGSPGLVVMGDDSCSRGHGFESRSHILDGIFSTLIRCKNCNDVSLESTKINKKWPGLAHFLKNYGFPVYYQNNYFLVLGFALVYYQF